MPISLTDPLISLLVQVPIGVATLLLLYVFMRITASERKQTSADVAADRAAAAEDRQQFNKMFERMVVFAEKSLSREADLTKAVNEIADINRNLPTMYQEAREGYEKRVLEDHRLLISAMTGVGESTDKLPNTIQEAAQSTKDNSDKNTREIISKVEVVDQKVTRLVTFGEIYYRVEENLRSINLTLEHTQAAESAVSKLRDEISGRLAAVEQDVKSLREIAIALPTPSKPAENLDQLATAAVLKRKTEPIPPMPTDGNGKIGPSTDAVNTVFDATPVIPPFQLGDTGGPHASAED